LLEQIQSATQRTTNVCEDAEKKEPLYTSGRNVSYFTHCGKQYGVSSENKKQNCHMIQ
jgi:hypothetical protein